MAIPYSLRVHPAFAPVHTHVAVVLSHDSLILTASPPCMLTVEDNDEVTEEWHVSCFPSFHHSASALPSHWAGS